MYVHLRACENYFLVHFTCLVYKLLYVPARHLLFSQVTMSFEQNPFGWGFGATSTVTSQSLLVYFTDVSASEIPRSNLNDTQLVQLSMGEAEETGTS